MTKALKTQGEFGLGRMIANLCAPLAPQAQGQRRAPRSIPAPHFAAGRIAAPLATGGGHPAPLSLPLSVTPFTILGSLGVKK